MYIDTGNCRKKIDFLSSIIPTVYFDCVNIHPFVLLALIQNPVYSHIKYVSILQSFILQALTT